MSSTIPPRVGADLNRMPIRVPFACRFRAMMCRMPPEVSLPNVINPCPRLAMQFWINTYSVGRLIRSEEHTSELQSLMRISYAVFCLKKKIKHIYTNYILEQ